MEEASCTAAVERRHFHGGGSYKDTSGYVAFDAKQDAVDCATKGSDAIPVEEWAHLVATFNKVTQEAKIDINGTLHKTCTGITDMAARAILASRSALTPPLGTTGRGIYMHLPAP